MMSLDEDYLDSMVWGLPEDTKIYIGRGNYEMLKNVALKEGLSEERWDAWAEKWIEIVEPLETTFWEYVRLKIGGWMFRHGIQRRR